jgi:ribosomal protein S4E
MKIILKYILLLCCVCFSTLAYSQIKYISSESCSSRTDTSSEILKQSPKSFTKSIAFSDNNSDYHVVLNKQNFIPMEVQSQETSYLQNRTITDNEAITGNKIEVGYDVTTSSPYGNVTVKNGASLNLKSTSGTFIKNGFECEKGATLVIE